MWDIFWLIFAASNVVLATNSAIKPRGKITVTPSVINLDSNVTFYTVSCQLDFAQDGINSSSLYIERQNKRIDSEILNERTITSVEWLSQGSSGEPTVCGERRYFCYGYRTGLDMRKVTVGWKPQVIKPEEIRCISRNLIGLRCEIPVKRPCDLKTNYTMSMNYRFGSSLCRVQVVGSHLIYDSEDEMQLCLYRNGVEILRFDLEVSNEIGSRAMSYELNNFDLVRPDPVSGMRVINVTSRDLEVRWTEDVSLDHLKRNFQYQFMLISEYGSNRSFYEEYSEKIYKLSMEKLQPYTNYTLMVRLRLVPKTPRVFEEDYWSEWSLVSFKTLASKPDRAPKTVPGAFSIGNLQGHFATIQIFWEHVPTSVHNGPGFGYSVLAKSDTGQMYYPGQLSSASPIATFEEMEIAHYRIFISCYNDLGSVEDHSVIDVFPTNPNQQPKIKRVLNGDHFEVSWYAPILPQNLTSYTVMYCNFTCSNVCQDSIRFEVLPPNVTAFKVYSSTVLNFAVSANFQTHSTSFSWQECIVSPSDATVGSPRFEIVDLREDSFAVTFDNDCTDRSFYEEMKVLVRKGSETVFAADVEPYREWLEVRGLRPNVEYEVQVQVFNGVGVVQGTRKIVMRAANENLLRVIFFISCGLLMALTILTSVTRRIRKIFYIKVETPPLLTVIVNPTTIEARQYLTEHQNDTDCSTEFFRCLYDNVMLDSKEVPVGRPPAEIEFERNFKCILYDLDDKYCEFTPVSQCDKSDNYSLTTADDDYKIPCALNEKNGTFYYSNANRSCTFPSNDGVTLRLDAINSIGNRTQYFIVNFDFIKIQTVPQPNLENITSDLVDVQIKLEDLEVHRVIESQFQFISKYDPIKTSAENDCCIVNYTMNKLYPFTEYKIGVRLRVIPLSPRLFEEDYWSDWSWSTFKTLARKPDRAPRVFPGAYSFKDQKGDRATIEIYWEPLAEFEWNGPGFRYNVSAITDTGQRHFPVIDSRDKYRPNEVASFEDLKIGHYWVLVSCYNNKGYAPGTSVMEVFPPKNDRKPKLKKVANDRNQFTVSWYPPDDISGISNYTVMYCNKTSSASCKDSIHFVTVPATQTSFNVSSPTVLNFAVSANYRHHSSDFAWQQCVVSSTTDIGSPQFDLCNITDTSFDIRMTTECSSNSFYELLHVYVLAMNGTKIYYEKFEQPMERIFIGGLHPSTNYTVKVVASDENGSLHETSNFVQTAPTYTKLHLTLYYFCGILATSALIMLLKRKVDRLRNIYVELPPALRTLLGEGEDECQKMFSSSVDHIERIERIYVDLPSRGYNSVPMLIPEVDEDIEDDVEPALETEETVNGDHSTATVDSQIQNKPMVPANGYVLASSIMTCREKQTRQLPPNMTSGSSSGYVMF